MNRGILLAALPVLVWSQAVSAHPCKLRPIEFRASSARPFPVYDGLAELTEAGGFRKSNRVPKGQRERHGVAEIVLDAAPARVLAEIQDYARYTDLSPRKFKTSKVVAISPAGATDVYMQLAVLRGALTIWQIMRFSPVQVTPSGSREIDGTYVSGNLSGAHARYVIESAGGADKTYVRLELLIELPVPAPQAAVDEELRDAAGDALRGLQRRFSP